MSAYCDFAPGDPVHGSYHDTEYGFPTTDEAVLFERLTLEVFQAGLSWAVILKKRENFRTAFDGFDVDKVAAYGDSESTRLLADAGIVRNKLKVAATIDNAKVIQSFRASHGGFADWIAANHPLVKEDWVKLFKMTFKFTGGEITGEFLMSIGYLPGVHRHSCPIFDKIAALNPPWMTSQPE
ncbi:MAG: DNA-3-methyladenine glycosylase I [Proteobacteria bacterium]|nr:DNA-3-methyladenine glycosylase I [Pseudomonadota bacterium]